MKRPIPFGKYYLLERINVGGMAEVFRAKAYGVEGFERLLAVKRILPNIAEDAEFIDMFIDEAKIAVQLNHANIAQIFDLGKVDDSHFIALEYVHGRDLRAIYDRCRGLSETMPVSQACFIVMKVCEGLDYAHNKRDDQGREMHLVHRDVSPQNVLVSYEGEVKLVDFGIAKAAGKASKTQAGILKGKFGYMSPEQVRGLPLDRRSDIFSVGVVLYEMLTGERLFYGESDFSTLEKVRNVEILPPSTYNRKIGEELEQIVLKALAKDVEDRYQNAIDLHDDLQAYVYTSGEFYARKDLAAWMKRTFAREIEEEARKLEAYRQMPAPELKPAPTLPPPSVSVPSVPRPPPVPGGGNGHPLASASPMELPRAVATVDFPSPGGAPPAPLEALSSGETRPVEGAPAPLTWDDDEVETQIYDKQGGSEDSGAVALSEDALEPDEDGPTLAPASSIVRTGPVQAITGPMPTATAPLLRASTGPVMMTGPLAPLATAAAVRRRERRARTAVYGVIAGVVVLCCAAAIYYFVVHGKRPGGISVSAIPSDVQVFLDGERQAGTGTPTAIKELKPGFYIVSVRKSGYESWEKTIEVKAGEETRVTPQLEALATASIELRTRPVGGEAFLDGRRLTGLTPMRISQVTPGRHRLEVKKGGEYLPWIHEFDVKPEEQLRLSVKLLPPKVAVKLDSEPKGEAFLERDGQRERLGRTPVQINLSPKYAYRAVVKREGYKEWAGAVEFDGDAPVKLLAKLEKEGATATAKEEPPPRPVASTPKQPPKPKPEPHVAVKPSREGTTKLRSPGRKPGSSRTVKPSTPTKVASTPTPPPTNPEPAGMGTLKVNSNPWTQIVIDGKDTGLTTPQGKIPLAAGKHKIQLKNPKFNIDESFTVVIKPDQPTKLVKTFQSGSAP
ncbi:MAG: serine/threonine protein kinase [Deltaproteobacteria bacterium]|nr:serine/threonine protein kinase [Deltaproteobacteria bacterium]